MIEIVMTRLDVGLRAMHEAATLLSGDERARASRYARARDRRRFIVARAELRRRLGARLRVPPHAVAFAYGPHGKPRLAGREGGGRDIRSLHFSVSHCGEIAALAFADGREIGVDIEAVRAVPEADAIAAQFCAPAEWRAYASLAEHEKLRGFLDWWTRREAFVKALGEGLGSPRTAADGRGWTLAAFVPGPGLVGAVAFATISDTGAGTIVVRR